MQQLLSSLRPCGECDHFQVLRENGQECVNGYCWETKSMQPKEGAWYCPEFRAKGLRMDPKLSLKYSNLKTRRRRRKKKGGHSDKAVVAKDSQG